MHIRHSPCHILTGQGSGHGKKSIKAVNIGSACSQSYQGVHIRRFVDQPLKSADKELLVDDHDHSGQQQFHQANGHMVFCQGRRDRPVPHHMSHGEVHQRNPEAQGSYESPLHFGSLSVF